MDAATYYTGLIPTTPLNTSTSAITPLRVTRGSTALSGAGTNHFKTTGFKNDGISTANTDYYQFTIAPDAGKLVSLTSINANFQQTGLFIDPAVSPSGVTSQFAYSLDGTNFTLIGSPVLSTSLTMPQVNLSNVAALQNVSSGTTVTLRYYASGNNATGSWGFYTSNADKYGLSIGGTVTNCTNPTSGGTIAGDQTLCAPANPATFTNDTLPSGQIGDLQYQWQSSTDNITFSDIAGATSSTYNAPSGLAVTTYYKRLARVSCQSDWTGAAASNVVTVTVNPIVNPTFTQVSPICLGGTLAALPTTSSNSIEGAWSPAINSTQTTLYTFVPTIGQCATNATMTITVNNSVTGTVSADQTIISGSQPANITLTNSSGNVQWQSSLNNISFTNIVGATNPTLTSAEMGALTTKKYYRAIVTSGSCSSVTSGVVTVTTVTTTSIRASQCGTTLAAMDSPIAVIVYPNAQMYRYKVTNGAWSGTYETVKTNFSFTKVVGITYDTTYEVSVAVKINGVWGAYGSSCPLTSPALTSVNFPVPTLRAADCGATLATLRTPIHSNLVYGAQGYRFEVTNSVTSEVYTYDSPIYYFNLSQVTTSATYSTSYSIRIAVKIEGNWGEFGPSCNVTTPALLPANIPTTKVMASYCGTTLAFLASKIPADVIYGAEGYRFEVTKSGTTVTFDSSVYNFKLSQTSLGATEGATYTIRVAAKVSGVYGNYGASCIVRTPSNSSTSKVVEETPLTTDSKLEVKVYPNPFTTNFKLDFSSSSDTNVEVVVYDMIGRQLERLQVVSSEMNNLELGNNYPSGVYNVIVKQGEEVKTLRVIKR
jgi:hypothetical protein